VCSTAPSVRAKIIFQHIVCHGCVLLVDSEFFVLAVYFLYCSSFETIRIVVAPVGVLLSVRAHVVRNMIQLNQ